MKTNKTLGYFSFESASEALTNSVALQEKTGDEQRQKDSFTTDHQCLYKILWPDIL